MPCLTARTRIFDPVRAVPSSPETEPKRATLAIAVVSRRHLKYRGRVGVFSSIHRSLASTIPEPVVVTEWQGPRATGRGAMSQGKLVRDKIPQIIRSRGLEPVIYVASADEYGVRLRDKLREEVEEFIASDNDPEELADVLEVLYALAERVGTDREQLEKLRMAKAEERGGFADRIIWSGNQPATPPGEGMSSPPAGL
jgi:predicted house-cleaning noncanonical NTP pyrophosphatase (MazG superfamily)